MLKIQSRICNRLATGCQQPEERDSHIKSTDALVVPFGVNKAWAVPLVCSASQDLSAGLLRYL